MLYVRMNAGARGGEISGHAVTTIFPSSFMKTHGENPSLVKLDKTITIFKFTQRFGCEA